MDRRGKPAVKAKTGKWKSSILLLVNYALVTCAFFGVGVNLVVFLRRVLHQNNAEAANSISKWTGTVYIFSLIGAFMSDSYWGRYITCAIFQMIYVTGLVILSLASWFLLVKPTGCGDVETHCDPPSTAGVALFYLSTYMIAFGNGGYQPSIATLGSDQFDETDPNEARSKVAFFSYFYLALNVGSIFSNTVLVYYEDAGQWVMGFWVSAGAAALALVLFLLGTPNYRYFKPTGNPLTRIAQVLVAATRKLGVAVDGSALYETADKESGIEGSRKLEHTRQFRFLDKAAVETQADRTAAAPSPWRLCTVTQVEELKSVVRLLPIWASGIVFATVYGQMSTMFVLQGNTLDASMGPKFKIPSASLSIFDTLSVIAWVPVYDRILVPAVRSVTGRPRGFTQLQRMGIGLVVSMFAMLAAGVLELVRLRTIAQHGLYGEKDVVPISIFWQVPQYFIIGCAEVFTFVGQLEFFYDQAPDAMRSMCSALSLTTVALGNYLSTLLVTVVAKVTTRGGKQGWIPDNLNVGHLDYFFWLLAALSLVNFAVYLLIASWYTYKKTAEDSPDAKGGAHDQ